MALLHPEPSGRRPDGGNFLRELAEHTAALDAWSLLDDPLRWLHAYIVHEVEDDPTPLPRLERRREWRRAALTDPAARSYLQSRGLDRATVRRFGLYFNARRNAIGFPVREGGRLVNVRWRYLAPAANSPKILGLRGRGSHLYPDVPPGRAILLACEGEFDALLLRQHGFPAVTSTAGTSWSPDWNRHVRGRQDSNLRPAD